MEESSREQKKEQERSKSGEETEIYNFSYVALTKGSHGFYRLVGTWTTVERNGTGVENRV